MVVLQEAPLPVGGAAEGHVWLGDNPRVGVVAAGRNGYRVSPGPPSAVQAAFPVVVTGPSSFHLLAVWTKPKPGYSLGLWQELDAHREFLLAAPSVVLGDFNTNARWKHPRAVADHDRVVTRLETEFGLVSAYHAHHGVAQGAEAHPTHYFLWKEARPFHIDYCFVPKRWRVTGAEVGDYAAWRTLSDHRPLVVDVRVPTE